jgi:hypothetical protein
MISQVKKNHSYEFLKDESILLHVFKKYAAFDYQDNLFKIRIDPIDFELVPRVNVVGGDPGDVFFSAIQMYREESFAMYNKTVRLTSYFVERVPELIRKYSFSPPHMKRIEEHNIQGQKESLCDLPKYLVDVPLSILEADTYIRENTGSEAASCFDISYCVKGGLPISVVTGVHSSGLQRNLDKMSQNKHFIDASIDDSILFSGLFMLLKDIEAPVGTVDIPRPNREHLVEHISKYKTSVGYIPLSDPVLLKGFGDKLQIHYDKMPTKKDAIKEWLADLMEIYWDNLELVLEHGDKDRFFPAAVIDKSAFKYELKNGHECDDLIGLSNFHEKVRLFFIEPAHAVMLSHIALVGLFNYLNMQGFEIGTRLNDGGFLEIFKNHDCGTTPYNTSETYDRIYDEMEFLREREYAEVDAESFDQTLLFKMLMMVALAFCMFFTFKPGTPVRTILGDISFRLVFKYLYLVPIQTLFLVSGMMFSGKYETSHGNTLYQNLVFFCYLATKLDEYKNHKYIKILRLCILWRLIARSFCGDDTIKSYPVFCKIHFNICIDDYQKFAAKLGIKFKIKKVLPLYGRVESVRVGINGWVTKNVKKGVTFLKNQVVELYEDEGDGKGLVFKGLYPFRATKDIFFRIGNSDRANGYIDSFFAKILSLSYLSFGNREAYHYLRVLYYLCLHRYKWDGFLDLEKIENIFRGSGIMYVAAKMLGPVAKFPTLQYLRNRHDEKIEKTKRAIYTFNDHNSFAKKFDNIDFNFF